MKVELLISAYGLSFFA